MKRIFAILSLATALLSGSCAHKELCYDHAHGRRRGRLRLEERTRCRTGDHVALPPSEGGRFAAALRIHRPPRRYYDSGADGRLRRFGAEQRHRAALFRNMGRRETFETYTREADLLATLRVHSDDAPRAEGTQDERVVAEPDMLWCDDAEGIELEREVAGQTVTPSSRRGRCGATRSRSAMPRI